nr:reverse transcriptase domain-containing protein [Tanacetum cinerariifolium]
MTQDDIKKLVADGVSAALEAQAANMANTDNTTRPRETPIARKCTYKEFMSCQPFYFNVKKIEDEFYNLVVKGNDLKSYIRRFQELATLCPTMVPNSKKLMKVFIEGLPRCIEGNVTALKPQTLKEAINITQRLMDQVTKHNYVQKTNDHKRKFDDSKNTNSNNYPNNRDHNNYPNDCNNNNHSNNRNKNKYQDNRNNNNRNNDHHQQQNRKQETFKTYVATNGY